MFTISKKPTSQKGQVLLIVLKDGKLDRGENAYVQQQVPEDFADYLIKLQDAREEALEEAAEICDESETVRIAAMNIRTLYAPRFELPPCPEGFKHLNGGTRREPKIGEAFINENSIDPKVHPNGIKPEFMLMTRTTRLDQEVKTKDRWILESL